VHRSHRFTLTQPRGASHEQAHAELESGLGSRPRGFESRILRCADQGKRSPVHFELIERSELSSQFRLNCSFVSVRARSLPSAVSHTPQV
jgi:hypothetical protein